MKHLYVIPTLSIMLTLFAAAHVRAENEMTAEEQIMAISPRIEALEKQLEERGIGFDWIDKVEITGLLEAEAGYSRFKPAAEGADDEESSDIVLSTMELGIDVAMNDYVSGHILFLWEEDATEPVDLDEGFITISAGDKFPVYLSAGKFYLPFGFYESYFISDPLTLELGETRESAVLLGYADAWLDVSAGLFNGNVDESEGDDHIDNYFGSASLVLPAGILPGISASIGGSYISNIADSDLLSEENDLNADGTPDGLDDSVAGISAYLSLCFMERLFLTAEYTGAMTHFKEGELAFGAGEVKPRAWNTELACVFEGGNGFGLKYEGASDTGDLLPETRYSAIGFCQPFEGAFLGLEYLREEYENGDKGNGVTVQLAYEF